uniref:Uncharacterized protein n=1 Tax=Nelumbo nucifera TaxID=4432 RepID=A0A822YID0_NELNU|nr:TPA_asm: hypothetical protein HUJ06_011093 [Nelumbo nucifera]
MKSHPAHKKLLGPVNYYSIEGNLVFVGVVGLRVSASRTLVWISCQ